VSNINEPTIEKREVAEIKQLLSEKRFDEAFDRSTALTREKPGNAEGWWRLTLAAKGLKRWEVARNAVKETINLVPRSPMVWGEFGDILEALEQDDEARKAFERSIKIDPDYGYAPTPRRPRRRDWSASGCNRRGRFYVLAGKW
jgi:tetratricopeptide (TPR) repeat protein